MKILAFDTTLRNCSVALLDSGEICAYRTEFIERGHAEALIPMVQDAMEAGKLNYAALDLVATTTGPGTFTGQRIGIAAARGIGLAQSLPVHGVSTLDAIAWGAASSGLARDGEDIIVALDARREELYAQCFIWPWAWPESRSTPKIVSLGGFHDWITSDSAVVVGTAADLISDDLGPNTGAIRVVPEKIEADAIHVAALAEREIQELGLPETPPAPLYLRTPDAKLPTGKTL